MAQAGVCLTLSSFLPLPSFAQEPAEKHSETRCIGGMSSSPRNAIYSFQERLAVFFLLEHLQERRDAWQDQAWLCGILEWAKVIAASNAIVDILPMFGDVGGEVVREIGICRCTTFHATSINSVPEASDLRHLLASAEARAVQHGSSAAVR